MKNVQKRSIDFKRILLATTCFLIGMTASIYGQEESVYVSEVHVSDNGDGTYTNPILHADYSDPDVVKVGDDFYMTASSFNAVPGLPILHSKDLVNWELVNHALPNLHPIKHFTEPQHGNGVWAPSIRYHDGEYYIFWGDPDFGIYMVKTDDPEGEWSEPHLVKGGKGLIDPSPLWDDDGRAYITHAYARSRSGINTVLVVQEMKPDASGVIGDPVLAFDGHDGNRVVEGPKFKKYNDTYYILAPAGGVTEGWQLAMRSDNVFGPYEAKTVLHQGSTNINGPHQGGLVKLDSGESWFVHFQDKGVYGRIVHLNPVNWKDGWPMMGKDLNNDGIGEPVKTHQKPDVGNVEWAIQTPPETDEFESEKLGLQWQWHGNPESTWALTSRFGFLRLYGKPLPEGTKNLWDVPGLLLQKFPAPEFRATTKLEFTSHMYGEKAGLIVMGEDYSYLSVTHQRDGMYVSQVITEGADAGNPEEEIEGEFVDTDELWFRVDVTEGGESQFSYSTDGQNFETIGQPFAAKEGRWIGAKVGLFANQPRNGDPEDYIDYSSQYSGFADFDFFRVTRVE
tara:strand:- start:3923 stop:5617 length:1695 start_codon:yes stop_codon:yes gene_type:complete